MDSEKIPKPDERASTPPPGDHVVSDASWDLLALHVEGFLECWESCDDPPRPAAHLPASNAVLKRMVLVELIKVDLEYRRQKNATILRLEDYLSDYPELAEPDGVPTDLIYEEYHVRRSSGEEADPNEYLDRFPRRADALARMFALDAPTASTALTGDRVLEAFRPGDHIDDFYLMSALGTGAFGSVYLARQESMQRLVALKISCDRGSEGRTLAQLDHPHIVRVHDQCRLEDRNLRLLYMQFAAGGTLRSVIDTAKSSKTKTGDLVGQVIAQSLERTGVLSPSDVPLKAELASKPWSQVTCRLGMELATALHYAHSHNILHRDVKPANVLLDANGSAKLADFNISFSSQHCTEGAAAYFGGSLAYMSPEQLEACHPEHARQPDELDGRSDVYSLGVLLWELMFGSRPFNDELVAGSWCESLQQMISMRREGPGEPPDIPMDDAGHVLLLILKKCLSPEPDSRYATAEELAGELSLCLEPRVARLLRRSREGLPQLAARWPLLAIGLATMVPNGLAGVFNFFYNFQAIIGTLKTEGRKAEEAFDVVQFVVNGIAFPIGLFGALLFALPVIRALKRESPRIAASHSQGEIDHTRRRALFLGTFAAGLGIVEWLIAGIVYPVSLHLILGDFGATDYMHFMGSMLICGMIAAAYPFFLLLLLAVHSFVPVLLQGTTLKKQDSRTLSTVSGQMGWFLFLAGAVPAAGMMLLLVTGQRKQADSSFALTVLSAMGAIGFAFAFSLYRTLQADVAALQEAARP